MGRKTHDFIIKRVRAKGRAYLTVRGFEQTHSFATPDPTPDEIAGAVAAIKAGPRAGLARPAPSGPAPDSLRALADAYMASPAFRSGLSEVTKTARRQAIDRLLETLTPVGRIPRAHVAARDLGRKHVLAIRDEAAATPETANIRVKVLRYMFAYAVDAEWPGVAVNPAREVKLLAPAVKTDAKGDTYSGHREWTMGEVERFLDFYRDDAAAYLAASLLLYTGARASDAVRLGPQHKTTIDWRGQPVECLRFRVTKGAGKRTREGKRVVEAVVPIVPELAAALRRARPGALVYLTGEHGGPWASAKSLGTRMGRWVEAMGPAYAGLTCHGMRKASATWWVRHYRASTHELMALFGWLTEKEAMHYTAGYSREDSAAGVVVRLPVSGR